ncbi:MAG TPA: hypothetical protein VKP66_14465 [Steroidobacteraceae bacterium]|nr:hypothetical protein [Steroidobacteraceae bacterium]
MADARECRECAERCIELANRCEDNKMRAALFEMAKAWTDTAIEFESIETKALRSASH